MKRKLCIFTFVGLAAMSFGAFAQTTPATAEAGAATSTAAPTNEVAQAQPAPDASTNAVAAGTNTVADAAAQPASPAADQPGTPAQPGAIIPLIVMDDVPLTDAIKNLARQAGLNYMLDPKVAFGQVGPDGKPIPQPTVSIRWENVTAEQALYALLSNYNLQLIEDTKSKIARITVRDPAAPDPLVTRIFQLKYATPTNIMVAVLNTFTDKRSKVVADVRTSQLVVVATEKEMPGLQELIDHLDTQTKQVLIEARLLETSMNPSTSKGVDWSGTLAAQNVTFGNGIMSGNSTTTMGGSATTTTLPSGRTVSSSAGSTVSTVLNSVIGAGGLGATTAGGFSPETFFLNADGVRAVLSFLNKYAEAKVISAPRTVTLDNEPAKIEVTRASPIINVTAGTANTTGGSQIQYTNLGVILNVTPRISANNYVNLKVTPEVSRIFDTVTKTVGSAANGAASIFQADEYDIRKIDTRVMIPSGHTLVLGGLVQDDVRNGNTKVPLLGDIPVFGYLFRSDTKTRQKSNLLVFLTPTIVQEEDFQPTPSAFLKTPVPTKDSVEGDWSAWDSGKPADWKDPDVSAASGKFDESLWQKDGAAPAGPSNQ
ncbi:MAG TPA: secretin N-terminal domain-containing protein [Verrucomicrobiae bacterium]|nr:secretin N-terminal domain-containing protein [Verrucomicrobiae bacterium]